MLGSVGDSCHRKGLTTIDPIFAPRDGNPNQRPAIDVVSWAEVRDALTAHSDHLPMALEKRRVKPIVVEYSSALIAALDGRPRVEKDRLVEQGARDGRLVDGIVIEQAIMRELAQQRQAAPRLQEILAHGQDRGR